MIPMKSGILDSNLVDDIFYKINEIYMHHAMFLAFLDGTLQRWDANTTIGDVIHKIVSIASVITTASYSPDREVLQGDNHLHDGASQILENCKKPIEIT